MQPSTQLGFLIPNLPRPFLCPLRDPFLFDAQSCPTIFGASCLHILLYSMASGSLFHVCMRLQRNNVHARMCASLVYIDLSLSYRFLAAFAQPLSLQHKKLVKRPIPGKRCWGERFLKFYQNIAAHRPDGAKMEFCISLLSTLPHISYFFFFLFFYIFP